MGPATVSVRELRQNLSVYLRRVAAGEALSITSRGEPVAVLAPLPGRGDPVARLIAEGRLRPPAEPGDLLDLGPPPKPEPGSRLLSELLAEDRRHPLA